MSEKRFCPECNTLIEGNETFCTNCGAKVPAAAEAPAVAEKKENRRKEAPAKERDSEEIQRNNVMGSINKTTNTSTTNSITSNTIDNSSTSSTVNNSSSSIDNSTVHNNTTIVMGGKEEPEFCGVCGAPFDGKHAKCPKCGKFICFDCRVKEKNRCVECEKKAVNEYRAAYRELLLTTGGDIGVAGKQMMHRKAQELDVMDVKKKIEEELNELYKPQQKAEQPDIIPAAPQTTANRIERAPQRENREEKGVGAISGRKPLEAPVAKSQSSGSKTWMFAAAAIVVAAAIFIFAGGGDNKSATPEQAEVTEAPAAAPKVEVQKPKETPAAVKTEQQPVQQTAPAAKKETPAPAKATDSNYEAGMKAYNSGDGLGALKSFKASGSAQSYYMIGVIYESGCGNVSKNAMMARQNFKKAANMGSEEAKAKL